MAEWKVLNERTVKKPFGTVVLNSIAVLSSRTASGFLSLN